MSLTGLNEKRPQLSQSRGLHSNAPGWKANWPRIKARTACCCGSVYRRFLFLSQKSSPATFDAFAELPPASATVAFMGPAPFFPSWKASPTPTTKAPAAGVYSAQPFGQACRLNANTVCSGRSCAWAGSVAALRMINENKLAIRMRNPSCASPRKRRLGNHKSDFKRMANEHASKHA